MAMPHFVKKLLQFLKAGRLYRERDRICILGKEYFFIDEFSFEKPIKSNRALERFVRLRVEAISPFALDDVLYGFFTNEAKVTIFIAYKPRVEQLFLDKDAHIFPEFLPSMVTGRDFKITRANATRDGRVIFHSAAENLSIKLSNPMFFNADLKEFKRKVRAKSLGRLSVCLDYGICLCLVALFLGCGVSLFLIFQNSQLSGLKKQANARESEVEDIASKYAFLGNVFKFYSRENFCLDALENINQVRPDDILFSDVNADADKKALKIKGHASSISSLEKYCGAMKRCANAISVETSNVRSLNHQAFFSVDVCFK
jgi:hypothetical protein